MNLKADFANLMGRASILHQNCCSGKAKANRSKPAYPTAKARGPAAGWILVKFHLAGSGFGRPLFCLAHGSDTGAPSVIEAKQVILHALQHLAFLAWSSVIDIKILGHVLDSLEPQVAGELSVDQEGLSHL